MKGIKSSREHIEGRHELIARMLATGATHHTIRQYWSLKYPELEKNTFYVDLRGGYSALKKYVNTNLDDIVSTHVALYQRNAIRAFELGKINDSTNALQAIEKLLGLHKIDANIQINNNNVNLDNMSVEQLDNIINKLLSPPTSTGYIQIDSANPALETQYDEYVPVTDNTSTGQRPHITINQTSTGNTISI